MSSLTKETSTNVDLQQQVEELQRQLADSESRLHAFLSLQILFYQEKKQRRHGESRHMASLVAKKEK